MKKLEKYSKMFSVLLGIMALLCTGFMIKHMYCGEDFVMSMIFAICLWIISGGTGYVRSR